MLHIVATIGSPVALATGLMFYFGWIRTRAEAQALGYDVAVTGMSAQDFVMKSILVLYVPLLIPILLALLLVWSHHRLVAAAARRSELRAFLLSLARAGIVSWPIWLTMCIGALVLVPAVRWFVVPVSLTMALLSATYGETLRRRLVAHEKFPPHVRALLLGALILAVFWDTERLASAVGSAYAANIAADPTKLVAVTVYSPQRLWITLLGTTETRLDTGDTAYKYRYDGLRLLQRSGGKYFLISDAWDTGHKRVVVLSDSPALRMEFSR